MRALVEVLDKAAFHDDADTDHHWDREKDGQRDRPIDDSIPRRDSEDVVNIGHIDLQRVAEKVSAGFIDDCM